MTTIDEIYQKTKLDCIYLCGGKGVRANLGHPKQYYLLGGKPLFIHGLEILRQCKDVGNIIIPTEDEAKIIKLCNQYYIDNIITVKAGDTRQESVYNALTDTITEYALIAEGVRPFINKEFVERIINTEAQFVVPISKSMASVITKDCKSINRELVGEVQLPQKYKCDLLKLCHAKAREINENNYTDDADLIINIYPTLNKMSGFYHKIIDGIEENIKLTTPLDIVISEAIYKKLNGEVDE